MTPENFIKKYLEEARSVAAKKNFHYLIPLSQAAIESSWGEKTPGNNFFGIKDSDGLNGNEILVTTTEWLDNTTTKFPVILSIKKIGRRFKYRVKDWFRMYPSATASFEDHLNFFLTNPRYKNALLFRNHPYSFFSAISTAGYATAANYDETLKAVMKSIIKRLPKNN